MLLLRFRGRKILKDSELIFSTPPAVMRKIINLGKEGATKAKSVEHSKLFCCPFPLIFMQLFNRSYVFFVTIWMEEWKKSNIFYWF